MNFIIDLTETQAKLLKDMLPSKPTLLLFEIVISLSFTRKRNI